MKLLVENDEHMQTNLCTKSYYAPLRKFINNLLRFYMHPLNWISSVSSTLFSASKTLRFSVWLQLKIVQVEIAPHTLSTVHRSVWSHHWVFISIEQDHKINQTREYSFRFDHLDEFIPTNIVHFLILGISFWMGKKTYI